MALDTPAATSAARELGGFRRAFDELLNEQAGPGWLRGAREAALARAEERGLPSPRDEEWRFTPVGWLSRHAFARARRHEGALPPPLAALRLGAGQAAAEIVFVNGRWSSALSTGGGSAGVRVTSLAEALASDEDAVQRALARVGSDGGVFGDLNTALWEDGALVVVPAGTVLRSPIHVVFLSVPAAGHEAGMSHTRTVILAERGSQACLMQTWAGMEGAVYLTTGLVEVMLEEGAVLDHYRLQQEGESAFHVSHLEARQARSSRFTDHALLTGAALSRSQVRVRLEGEGAECTLDGLLLARSSQHVDAHTVIDHASPHCSSRELYNGILDGKARGVFHGRIVVRPQAQKTDARQANHNLLLSREALVNSTPALEINADDVRCRHGSTTGQLDPLALFYLRSRGLDEAAARATLAYAFAAEVIGRMEEAAARQRLEAVLRQRLPGVPEELLS